jgi:hypothetical protein
MGDPPRLIARRLVMDRTGSIRATEKNIRAGRKSDKGIVVLIGGTAKPVRSEVPWL